MDFEIFLNAHKKYGTTKEDIIARNSYDLITENVVIAPWWKANMFENKKEITVTKLTDKLYNIKNNKTEFTFIELRRMGAPMMMEECLSIGVSKCKNLTTLGTLPSVGIFQRLGQVFKKSFAKCVK